MRVEIVAVGSELLLGQLVDTNSAFIAEQLAAAGIDCFFQTRVGDNIGRIEQVLRAALERNDAVVTCGGLGPTQDDLTREAIAAVMGVELRRDPAILAELAQRFAARNRTMTANNARQADVPAGAAVLPNALGTAPGLRCELQGGTKVVYALPGVPHEMQALLTGQVLPDLVARAGLPAVIVSRTLRTWGLGESALAELVTPRLEALDAAGPGAPTIAFLASGIEGIKLRLTVKAPDEAAALAALDAEEAALREVLGPTVFGVDRSMEEVIAELLLERSLRLATAESLTGGLVASRLVGVVGASRWFAGGVVAYSSELKRSLLGVTEAEVVSEGAALQMAVAARDRLGAEVGLSTTGVAGPEPQDARLPGTVFVAVAVGAEPPEAVELALPGDRERVRQLAVISALDLLRRRLLGVRGDPGWSAILPARPAGASSD